MANIDLSRVAGTRQIAAPGSFGEQTGNKLVLTQSPRGSLFAGKDSLSSLLATMAQRQAIRRVEKPAKGSASKRRGAMSDTQKAELARVRTLIQSGGAIISTISSTTCTFEPSSENCLSFPSASVPGSPSVGAPLAAVSLNRLSPMASKPAGFANVAS